MEWPQDRVEDVSALTAKMQMFSDCGTANRGPFTADAANGVQPKTRTIGQFASVQMHSPMTFLGIIAPRLGYSDP